MFLTEFCVFLFVDVAFWLLLFAVLPAAGASDGQACGAGDEGKGRRAEVGPARAGDRGQAREGTSTQYMLQSMQRFAVVAAAAAAVVLVRGRLQQALPVKRGNTEMSWFGLRFPQIKLWALCTTVGG